MGVFSLHFLLSLVIMSSFPAGQRIKAIMAGKVFIQFLVNEFIEIDM
jgi:hypothetical protein